MCASTQTEASQFPTLTGFRLSETGKFSENMNIRIAH